MTTRGNPVGETEQGDRRDSQVVTVSRDGHVYNRLESSWGMTRCDRLCCREREREDELMKAGKRGEMSMIYACTDGW